MELRERFFINLIVIQKRLDANMRILFSGGMEEAEEFSCSGGGTIDAAVIILDETYS